MSYDASIILNATARTTRGKNAARRTRVAGEVPVAVYGGGVDPVVGTVNKREIAAHIRAHGRAGLFNLNFDGQTSPVKIAEVQIDPVKSTLVHIDLVRLSLTEKSEFEVPIKVQGESAGVKLSGGVLDVVRHSVKIRCLPTDLPDFIVADVSSLALGGHLSVKELTLPEGVEVRTVGTATVATVVAVGATDEPVAAAEPEVAKKGKDAKK
jgi:large subunit ribosomal protein L25